MKNISSEKGLHDKIENVKQVSIEKQIVYLGTARPRKGHTMFEVNYKFKTIVEAKYDEIPAIKFEDAKLGIKSSSKKITKKTDCIYVSALNKKNAIKVLSREFGENFNNIDYGIK